MQIDHVRYAATAKTTATPLSIKTATCMMTAEHADFDRLWQRRKQKNRADELSKPTLSQKEAIRHGYNHSGNGLDHFQRGFNGAISRLRQYAGRPTGFSCEKSAGSHCDHRVRSEERRVG